MLTLKMLKDMKPHAVIARGESVDSPLGINMTGSGAQLRWVAVRGVIYDWTIYTHHAWQDWDYILSNGDKVRNRKTIKRLVPCDDEAFDMYRF